MARTALLLGLLAAAACRGTDRAYLTADGKEVRALAPAPYRIALAPIVSDGRLDGLPPPGKGKYWFTLTEDGLQALFVAMLDADKEAAEAETLETQRAANHVFAVAARDLPGLVMEAQAGGADLIVIPRLVEPPRFAYEKRVRTLASLALWFGTWVGGLHVQDKRYETHMVLDFDVLNARDGTTLDTFTATSESTDLTLWERDGRRFRSGTASSLVLPPQLSANRDRDVSEALSMLTAARLAARFAAYLKEDLPRRERSLHGAVRAVEPPNAAFVSGRLSFRAEIIAERPITHVLLYLNGELQFEIAEGADGSRDLGPLDPANQAAGRYFRLSVARHDEDGKHAIEIDLPSRENELRLEYAVLGRYASRTFVYKQPER